MTSGRRLLELFLHELEVRESKDPNLFSTFSAAAAAAANHQQTKRLRKLVESLKLCDPLAAFLGCPGFSGNISGDRLIWLPFGLPDKQRVGFASSRLGHSPDEYPLWFDTLRTVCARLKLDREAVVCTRDTAGFEFIQRCAYLFGCDRIELVVADDHIRLEEWLLDLETSRMEQQEPGCFPAFLSPRFVGSVPRLQELVFGEDVALQLSEPTDSQSHSRDAWHCQLCQVIYALHVTKKGNTFRALSNRSQNSSTLPATIFIPAKGDLVDETVRNKLVEQGALLHYLYEPETSGEEVSSNLETIVPADRVRRPENRLHPETVKPSSIQWFDAEQQEVWSYLTHCTRRRAGPWPDEDRATYLDDLIFRRVGANHSALAALCRILRTRKLVATAEFVRGESRVVSFSEKPLPDLLAQRVFRSHLSRWDFEPYGICVDRYLIAQFAARPVIYGSESDFEQLAEVDRPFFQKTSAADDAAQPGIDWTIEQEWRLIGDLSLSRIPPYKAFAFVPTWEEAEFVAQFSRFPIRVIATANAAENQQN